MEHILAAERALKKDKLDLDYWTSAGGQAELRKRSEAAMKPPESRLGRWRKQGDVLSAATITGTLCPLDYIAASKANANSAGHLSPMGPASEEWFQVELTADSGACDTVIPKSMCPGIPIMPSFQSLRNMEYEVANGESIPNLGERRCQMWTEGATQPKNISMQVADVHKALLSLSRCADMGFESRFGSAYGALIDTETGEVIPLTRKGNLYVLNAWIRAAPFGRQEVR